MKNDRLRGEDFCRGLIKYLVYFILLYALCSCILCVCGFDLYGLSFSSRWIVWISTALLLISVAFIPVGRLPFPAVMGAGFLLANLVMWRVAAYSHTVPVSDWGNIFNAAFLMEEGNFDANNLPDVYYTNLYNWQTGIAWFESMLFRLFRPSVVMLKVLNWILINVTIGLVYCIGKKFIGRRGAMLSFLLISIFYPMLVAVGQFSNQVLVTPLLLVFILLISRGHYLWAGLLMPCISFLRPVGPVLWVTVLIFIVCMAISRKMALRKALLNAVVFTVCGMAVTTAIDYACMYTGYARGPVSRSPIPYFKFYQGLYISEWNNPADKIAEFDGDFEKYNEWTRGELRKAYTENLGQTLKNNFLKMTMFLGTYDWKFAYTYNQIWPDLSSSALSRDVAVGWGEYMALLILCLAGYGRYFRRRKIDYLQILFIGFVAVYFFIEAWPDYRYEIYPLMFIIAGALPRFKKNRNLISILLSRQALQYKRD